VRVAADGAVRTVNRAPRDIREIGDAGPVLQRASTHRAADREEHPLTVRTVQGLTFLRPVFHADIPSVVLPPPQQTHAPHDRPQDDAAQKEPDAMSHEDCLHVSTTIGGV
jgi:hypothetical protein